MTCLRDHSPALVAAIERVFHNARPCRCEDEGKLSERQVLIRLAAMQHVSLADIYPAKRMIPITAAIAHRAGQRFKDYGIEYLEDLTQYSYRDLLHLPDVGETNANLIEAAMAKYGLLLRDGDPAQLRDAPPAEPEPVGRRIEGSASAVRKACSKALFKSGEHRCATLR